MIWSETYSSLWSRCYSTSYLCSTLIILSRQEVSACLCLHLCLCVCVCAFQPKRGSGRERCRWGILTRLMVGKEPMSNIFIEKKSIPCWCVKIWLQFKMRIIIYVSGIEWQHDDDFSIWRTTKVDSCGLFFFSLPQKRMTICSKHRKCAVAEVQIVFPWWALYCRNNSCAIIKLKTNAVHQLMCNLDNERHFNSLSVSAH